MKKTTAAYFLMFFVLIVVLYKPFTYASVKSALPYVVAAIQYTVGLKFDGTLVAVGYSDNDQNNVLDWVTMSPDVMTKTPPLTLKNSK